MRELPEIGLQKRFIAWAQWLVWFTMAGSILILLAWQFDIEIIKRPLPDLAAMNPMSALCFFLSTISFQFINYKKSSVPVRRLGYTLVILVLIVGLLKMITAGLNTRWQIDNWLFIKQIETDAAKNLFVSMAHNTALCFVLMPLSILLMHYRPKSRSAYFQLPAVLFILIAFFSCTGYLYHVPEFRSSLKLLSMAIQTAVLFIFLGFAILFVQPGRGLMATFTNNLSGNIIARVLIPATIIIPVVLGFLRLLFQWWFPISTELGVSILVMATIFVFTALMWHNIKVINTRAIHQSKTELKFKNLLEAAPDAIIITGGDGRIQLINRQTEKMFGYQREELIGHELELLMPKRFRLRHQAHRNYYFTAPKIRSMGEGLELFGLKKDGTEFYIEISLSPLETPEGTLVSAAIRDITDRKKEEEKFRSLLEAAPDAMIIVDGNGLMQLVNRQAEKMFGYPREEMMGRAIEMLMPERFRSRHPAHRENYFTSPKIRGMGEGLELFGIKKNGTEFFIEISLSPLETPEGLLVSAAIRDITDRKKEEEKFRSLLEAAPDAMIIVGDNGLMQLVNRQAENMFGYQREEMIGREIEILIPERFRSRHPGHRDNYFTSPKIRGMGEGLELFGLKKDGTEFFIEISLSPLETTEGLLVSAAIRDISERKNIEERLKQFNKELEKEVSLKAGELVKNEKRFRGMIENSNDLVVLTNEQFKPFYRSPNFERITGWTLKELDSKDADFFINAHDLPAVQTLQQNLLSHPAKPFTLNFRFKHKLGHEIWMEGVAINLLNDEAIQGIVSNLRDVSERKEAEIKIANSRRIYQTIASNIPGSIILLFDTEHRYILIEGDLMPRLGYSKEELLDKKASEILPTEIYAVTKPRLDRVFKGEYFTTEGRSNGLDLHSRYIPIRNELQEVTLAMLVVIDITELKNSQRSLTDLNANLEQKVEERTRQLEMVNSELEAFTYSVSHDLRAPLRIIDGFADIALTENSSKLDADGIRALDIIKTNAQRMGQLIDDLLNLSRYNRKEITITMVDMNTLVQQVAEEQQLLNKKRITISCDQLIPVRCDGGLLKQVWINLISNAIKYSAKKEHPQIHISSYQNERDIVYYIKDNGTGFDMQYADKLFGVFQRLHKQNEFEGTGVGLALVQRIIVRHAGKIWAEAEPDAGATFYFSLPAE